MRSNKSSNKKFEKNVETKIKGNLSQSKSIVSTTDGWSSSPQGSFITVTTRIIDLHWNVISYTLTTHEMEELHIAENLSIQLENTLNKWKIDKKSWLL